MAIWYIGSVQYTAVPTWAASTAYTVGQYVRQLATPSAGNERVFRCTTAGTSAGTEPSWSLTNNSTTNSGTAVFTEVSGKTTHGWSAPHKSLYAAAAMSAPGDTFYVANNHNFTTTPSTVLISNVSTMSTVICVNPGGSVPPVAADLSTGAIDGSTTSQYYMDGTVYVYGMTFSAGGGNNLVFCQGGGGEIILENCTLILTSTSSGGYIAPHYSSGGSFGQTARWKNVTVKFGHVSQYLQYGDYIWEWLGGALDTSVAVPTTPFRVGQDSGKHFFSGVDFSGLGSAPMFNDFAGSQSFQFVNCKLPTSYVFYSATFANTRNRAFIDVIISDNSTANYKHERYAYDGRLTIETVVVKTGGASDGTQAYSWKLVSSTKPLYASPFETFTGAIWNSAVGASKTLTFEIISSATLKDNEVSVDVEYLGTVGSMKSTILSTTPTGGILAAGANLATSTAVWTTTGLATPTTQKIVAIFTPQIVGYVRWRVRLHKASTTVYVDPAPVLS